MHWNGFNNEATHSPVVYYYWTSEQTDT